MKTIGIYSQTLEEIAPCVVSGPYASPARRLIAEADRLGKNAFASTLRAWCVWYVFDMMEQIFRDQREPASAVSEGLGRLASFLQSASDLGLSEVVLPSKPASNGKSHAGTEIKDVTGDHYGNLFKQFSDLSYWDEPVKLLRERLERNGFSQGDFEGNHVLDAGCGGGRYSVAWRLLGAGTVVGLDVSPINVEDANRRVQASGVEGVTFKEGDVLGMPFADDEFDIVFSNGVLHHTTEWETGVDELVRVLKPGGLGWLYLIEDPGGLFWDMIEVLRVVLRDESKADMRAALASLNIPANRIFYMLDHVMVPVNVRLTPDAIRQRLEKAGATEIRRLTRGCDFDRVEHIHRETPYAIEYFGVGENRFVFSK